MKSSFTFLCFFSTVSFFCFFSLLCQALERPNVLLILADDLGWSDTTLYGTTQYYQTPNLERLAKRGVTFTRAYSASPLCSPTRSSIMTGLHPARLGITTPSCHLPEVILTAASGLDAPPNEPVLQPFTVTRLNTTYNTLAESLKKAGYATAHFGKWHLGREPYSPLEHGFDTDIPHYYGPGPAGSYVAPWKFKNSGTNFDADQDVPDQHLEDRMAQEAVRWLEQHKDEPFFLNYWMFSVHAPFDAKKTLIEKYRQRLDSNNPQHSPTYAAMIESMDDAVGTLLDALDRLGIADTTMIIFYSDNGGNMYDTVDDTTPTSNIPLRGGKGTLFEGGIRVPCVTVLPGVTKSGTQSDQIIQSCDLFPTILDILGLKSETNFDGISIVPVLKGETLERDTIFTFFPHYAKVTPDWLPPAVSVHSGDWKLIRIFHGELNGQHQWKLYNLREDIGEKNDLAAKEPERVKELDAKIEQFLVDTKAVVPIPNPKFKPELHDSAQIGVPVRHQPRVHNPSVAGWTPSADCKLKIEAGTLLIESNGNDPQIVYHLPKPLLAGKYQLELTLSSNSQGQAQFFWHENGIAPTFIRHRSVLLKTNHDGEVHNYRTEFTAAHEILAVRFDPSTASGKIRLTEMKLTDTNGKIVQQWKFKPKQ
ncbi:MAG: sulfatase [Planctomycetaceae bacterium]|jgi:arylsulfatase A-like enzyme|nr:sulfatase [Planctomycetaceae bacterium]